MYAGCRQNACPKCIIIYKRVFTLIRKIQHNYVIYIYINIVYIMAHILSTAGVSKGGHVRDLYVQLCTLYTSRPRDR